MPNGDFLRLGNVRKTQTCLAAVVNANALAEIENEIQSQVQLLFDLAIYHYQFAAKQSSIHWRQKISRLYYACYACSRAIRLYHEGIFSVEVKDHQQIDNLPKDFPEPARFKVRLGDLRSDRNTSDYDHLATQDDLILEISESTELTKDFLKQTKLFMSSRGFILSGDVE